MNLILFDTSSQKTLYPLSSTRPVAQLRIGIHTIAEKWERALNLRPEILTSEYLVPEKNELSGESIVINSSIIPDEEFVAHVQRLLPQILRSTLHTIFLSQN